MIAAGASEVQDHQQRTSYESQGYDVDDQSSSGYDPRSSEEYEYQQQHYSNPSSDPHYSTQSAPARANGGGGGGPAGYSVATTHDYLGYPKDQQPFGQQSLWEDEKSEDLW